MVKNCYAIVLIKANKNLFDDYNSTQIIEVYRSKATAIAKYKQLKKEKSIHNHYFIDTVPFFIS